MEFEAVDDVAVEEIDTIDADHLEGVEQAPIDSPEEFSGEAVDDNGEPYRTEIGEWIPNNEYTLDGSVYKTDENGSVYQCDGKYYPNDWFVLNGNLYVTDSNGEVIGGDIDEDDQAGESAADQEGTQELTDEDRAKIKEETGWSDEIVDNIQNMEQYEILKNANLIEVEINGRKC